MIFRVEEMKDACKKILAAVDSNEISTLTETLELKTNNNLLEMNVTNREYFAQVTFPIDIEEVFHATVNAKLFLKLIEQITTDTIELSIKANTLVVKGNGTYKLPLIFDNDKLLELPKIDINNVTNTFVISSDTLNSILLYNSKELTKGNFAQPIQKYYYLDEKGAITFTTGACVNSFTLDQPVKLLLNSKLVKLFKLFKNEDVIFTVGHDCLSDSIIQTKVNFKTSNISITAILNCDDKMLSSMPANAIRNRAFSNYPYSIVISRVTLLETLNRLSLFNCGYGNKEVLKPYSKFEFNNEFVTIYDVNKDNSETIYYDNSIVLDSYEATLDLFDLRLTLENCSEDFITINFGNNQAMTIQRANIINVIPECKVI